MSCIQQLSNNLQSGLVLKDTIILGENRKYIFQTHDHLLIEGAYIFLEYREQFKHILCLSSQAGCPFCCEFCYNKDVKFSRNLSHLELTEQIHIMLNDLDLEKDELVEVDFMGVGEPLLNLQNVLRVINSKTNSPNLRFGLSSVFPPINLNKFLYLLSNKNVRLQLSLHSPLNEKRERLLGVKSNFQTMLEFAERFHKSFPLRKVALNICLVNGLNDSNEELAALIRHKEIIKKHCYIKLSLLNHDIYEPSQKLEQWVEVLEREEVDYKLFKSRGSAQGLGCGQLTYKQNNLLPD